MAESDREINVIFGRHHALSQLTFPYHILRSSGHQNVLTTKSARSETTKRYMSSNGILQLSSFFTSPFRCGVSTFFPKIYAAENDITEGDKSTEETSVVEDGEEQAKYSAAMEALAHAYIQQESGWDRIRMMFEKDHRGKQDVELGYIQLVIAQVFILTFFGRYFPAAKFARQEFIRENQGTVFKTRFEAVRRLQDHTFTRAAGEAAAFSTKITIFSASFLLLSSMISSYRNKTSVLEYTVAAGITGGLARANMGLKGCFVGTLVGGVLGSLVGLLGYTSLSLYGLTQQDRHLENIKSKLEVLKSIEGESNFRNKIVEILEEDGSLQPIPVS